MVYGFSVSLFFGRFERQSDNNDPEHNLTRV